MQALDHMVLSLLYHAKKKLEALVVRQRPLFPSCGASAGPALPRMHF
jgi:hypothetical protein